MSLVKLPLWSLSPSRYFCGALSRSSNDGDGVAEQEVEEVSLSTSKTDDC